jgi:hypothetical protein
MKKEIMNYETLLKVTHGVVMSRDPEEVSEDFSLILRSRFWQGFPKILLIETVTKKKKK